MKMHKRKLGIAVGAALLAAPLFYSATAHGQTVIYRETFSDTSNTTIDSLAQFDWAAYIGATGAYTVPATPTDTTTSAANLTANPNAAGSTKLTTNSYNTQVNAGNTFGTGTAGLPFVTAASGAALIMTPEYATTSGTGQGINPSNYQSLVFSWYEGNTDTAGASDFRVAIEIGTQWYASATAFTTLTTANAATFYQGDDNGNGGAGGHGSELKSLTFNPAAGAWDLLNFNGTYTLGAPGTGTSSTVGLSLGAATGSALPAGNINAFGLFSEVPGSGNRRFDSFSITVPEPATLGLSGLAGFALLGKRRRKA